MEFNFVGQISSSKSLFNRALIARSFDPTLQLIGFSDAEDVRAMKTALSQFSKAQVMDCAQAGTVIRFLAFRVARETGEFRLTGSRRLLSRPMSDLVKLLGALGVQCEWGEDSLALKGQGWKRPLAPLKIHGDKSSQFASGLLLSAWDLDFDLHFELEGPQVSLSYFQMTLMMMRELGLEVREREGRFVIPAGQKIKARRFQVEPDYSSMFPIAVAGALAGSAEIRNMGHRSLQPDFQFVEILKAYGVEIRGQIPIVTFRKPLQLQAQKISLTERPDLFPVLAVLASFAQGESRLGGAPQLVHKESNRLLKTQELLQKAGISCQAATEGLSIQGAGMEFVPRVFEFDPDQDHRMAMAAGLLRLRQPGILIRSPEVVDKSFPEFWRIFESSTGGVWQ